MKILQEVANRCKYVIHCYSDAIVFSNLKLELAERNATYIRLQMLAQKKNFAKFIYFLL